MITIKTFKSFLYCLALISLPCSAQFSDDFSDGDFRKNPYWTGDTTHFEINAQQQLHLNAPAITAKSFLVVPSDVSTDAVWKFWLQLDFNPSSSNYAKVLLVSDKARPDSAMSGYYLRIGGTDDDISLFRQDGTTSKILTDGRNGMLNASINKLTVKVTRSLEGDWVVNCDTTGAEIFETIGSVRDTTYWMAKYFGVQCIYTSTRSNKFLFDNFEITGKRSRDTIPPSVRNAAAVDDSVVLIRFSEEVDIQSASNFSNYKLPDGITIKKLEKPDASSVKLHLSRNIDCKQKLEFSVLEIVDNSGNAMSPASLEVSFCPGVVYDVLVTEIMADPDPPVSLPNLEYVELYNKSGTSLNLEKWKLQVGQSQIVFPALAIPKDSFLVVCTKAGCSQLGNRLCVDLLSSGTLNNTGEYIGLKNSKGTLIHWLNYDESFYQDELKKSGGWSLEMIDTEQPCLGRENWKASSGLQGGTPGKNNSTKGTVTDSKPFRFQHVFLPSDSTTRLYFSKPLDISAIKKSHFALDHDFGNPVMVATDTLQNLFIDLHFRKKFMAGIEYRLDILENMTACTGQKSEVVAPVFMKPALPVAGDMIINEILFDALPGNQEFVEFYNKSDKYFSSSDFKFAYRTPSAAYNSTNNFGKHPFLVPPHTFVVVTKNAEGFDQQYHIPDMRFVLSCSNFPTLGNTEGCIALMTKSLETFDELCYSEKMHFSLLVNKSGVSLERIRYNSPTSELDNWHSASSTEGYATPGAQNSQFLEDLDPVSEINLEHEIFSPDNDGYKDVETISYKLDQPGFVANIVVFDALGRRIRILANNKTLGTQGSFIWDGIDDKGRLAQTGIYLIYIELHHPSGEKKQYKKTCVLGGEMRK